MQGRFGKALAAAMLLTAMTVTVSGCDTASSTPLPHPNGSNSDSKPNVVILFADDLGYGDLGSFGHPYIRTPHIDSLAAQAALNRLLRGSTGVLTQSCRLLAGRLPVRSGLYGNAIRVYFPNEPGGLPQQETTLAEALKAQGYYRHVRQMAFG